MENNKHTLYLKIETELDEYLTSFKENDNYIGAGFYQVEKSIKALKEIDEEDYNNMCSIITKKIISVFAQEWYFVDDAARISHRQGLDVRDLILKKVCLHLEWKRRLEFFSEININDDNKKLIDTFDGVVNPPEKRFGCYIATMVYGDYDHPQVMILRQFRDEVLDKSAFGKWFIKTYYHYSPRLVERLKNQRTVNIIIRKALNQFINLIK